MATKMVAVRLDEETHERLRIFCIRQKTSIQALLEEYIKAVLEAHEEGVDLPAIVRAKTRE